MIYMTKDIWHYPRKELAKQVLGILRIKRTPLFPVNLITGNKDIEETWIQLINATAMHIPKFSI